MKKNFSIIIILFVVLSLYTIIVITFSKNPNNNSTIDPGVNNPNNIQQEKPKEEENAIDILLSPNTIVSYSNNKWFENKKLKYNNVLFDVFVNNEAYGDNYLTYNSVWYIYDQHKNFKDYNGNVLAIKTKKSYNLINFVNSKLDENDKKIITAFLENKNITFNYEQIKKSKIIYDFNHDGFRESLYIISNAFSENEYEFNKSFSFIFLNKTTGENNIVYETQKDISANYLICNPYIHNMLNIENKTIVVAGCNYFSNGGTEHHLYELQNQDFIRVLKTSINQ